MGNIQEPQEPQNYYINQRIIYTEYGMNLKCKIIEKQLNGMYIIFQDNGIYNRLVHEKYLKIDNDYYDPPPPYY